MQEFRIKRKPTGRHPGLHSLDSRIFKFTVKVNFINATRRNVDILWAGYEYDYIVYHTLRPRQICNTTTYVGHPWVFEDAHTRDPMVVQGSEVWWPPSQEHITIYITLPVLSLTTLAARAVRDHLKSAESATELEIPLQLQNYVEKLARGLEFHKNRHSLVGVHERPSQEPTDVESERIVLVALKLHSVLWEIEGSVPHRTLMAIQLFLQYIQTKVDPHHAAVQALLMAFQTHLGDVDWIEVDPLLLNHVEEIVEKMLRIVDNYDELIWIPNVLNFIAKVTDSISSKYTICIGNGASEEV